MKMRCSICKAEVVGKKCPPPVWIVQNWSLTMGPCMTPIWAPPAFSSNPPAIWAAKFCKARQPCQGGERPWVVPDFSEFYLVSGYYRLAEWWSELPRRPDKVLGVCPCDSGRITPLESQVLFVVVSVPYALLYKLEYSEMLHK